MSFFVNRLLRVTLLAALVLLAGIHAFGQTSLTTLASFDSIPSTNYEGAVPEAGLVQGSDGYFYGTTFTGGTDGDGTVFKISSSGSLTTLYSFTNGAVGNDGANPQAALVQGTNGYFYGTTYSGGSGGNGTVFKISSSGSLTTLYSFTGNDDGANPQAALVQGTSGYFYGTTTTDGSNGSGTVFKIDGGGSLNTLYSFSGGADGGTPEAPLILGTNGYLYGTTNSGANAGNGTVFNISASGSLATLYSFAGGDDGGNSQAALVQGTDGYFYGTTYSAGSGGNGTVFQMTSSGSLTTVYSFTGGNDGGTPPAALVQGTDGNFYHDLFRGKRGRGDGIPNDQQRFADDSLFVRGCK